MSIKNYGQNGIGDSWSTKPDSGSPVKIKINTFWKINSSIISDHEKKGVKYVKNCFPSLFTYLFLCTKRNMSDDITSIITVKQAMPLFLKKKKKKDQICQAAKRKTFSFLMSKHNFMAGWNQVVSHLIEQGERKWHFFTAVVFYPPYSHIPLLKLLHPGRAVWFLLETPAAVMNGPKLHSFTSRMRRRRNNGNWS